MEFLPDPVYTRRSVCPCAGVAGYIRHQEMRSHQALPD